MKDNKIIKALECCCTDECEECPYYEQTACIEYAKQGAIDLINRQKAEIKSLTEKLEALGDPLQDAHYKIAEQQAEIERLNGCVKSEDEVRAIMKSQMTPMVNEIVNEQFDKAVKLAKAEAINEFAEKFYSMIDGFEDYDTLHIYEIKDRIDLVKEKIGDIPKLEHNSLCETDIYKVGE